LAQKKVREEKRGSNAKKGKPLKFFLFNTFSFFSFFEKKIGVVGQSPTVLKEKRKRHVPRGHP
jgi:hypothetical protein